MSEMSLRAYSRHRGVSLASVQKAIAYNRIQIARRETRGKKTLVFIDSAAADIAWLQNTNDKQQRCATRKEMGRGHQTPAPKKEIFPEADPPTDEDSPAADKPARAKPVSKNSTGPDGDIYFRARAKKEKFEALQAELDYLKDAGKLVPMDKIKVAFANMAQLIQQNLLNIPARFSANIAAAYKKIISEQIENIAAGAPATKEDLLKWSDAVMDEKIASDILLTEIRLALQVLADDKLS